MNGLFVGWNWKVISPGENKMNVTPEVIERLKRLASLLSKNGNTPKNGEKDKNDLDQNANGNEGVNNAASGESLSGKMEKSILKVGLRATICLAEFSARQDRSASCTCTLTPNFDWNFD